jgi:hypothetical protein
MARNGGDSEFSRRLSALALGRTLQVRAASAARIPSSTHRTTPGHDTGTRHRDRHRDTTPGHDTGTRHRDTTPGHDTEPSRQGETGGKSETLGAGAGGYMGALEAAVHQPHRHEESPHLLRHVVCQSRRPSVTWPSVTSSVSHMAVSHVATSHMDHQSRRSSVTSAISHVRRQSRRHQSRSHQSRSHQSRSHQSRRP